VSFVAIRRFEELKVWQTARELARGSYGAGRTQALGSDRALLDQMKRAAVSISSNIAEGFERGTRKQQIEFCYLAKGSAGELRSQLILAHDLGLLNDTAYEWLIVRGESCSRMLAGYIALLSRTVHEFQGQKFHQSSRNHKCSTGEAGR
jgi:four helix bundle protein